MLRTILIVLRFILITLIKQKKDWIDNWEIILSHLDLDGADLGPGHDVVEVVLVHEVMAGVAAAHHQRNRGLVILWKEKINKNPRYVSVRINN